MIDYIIAHNPDDRVIRKASQILKNDGLVCLPLESHWAILASPYSRTAVEKLYQIRKVDQHKHFSALCHSISLAQEVAHINNAHFRILKKTIPGPYTFIFSAQKKITRYLKASKSDHQIGIRFPHIAYVQKLLEHHQDILLASHLSIEMFSDLSGDDLIYSTLIDEEFSHLIDQIIDPGDIEFIDSTTILDLTTDGPPQIIRLGSGEINF